MQFLIKENCDKREKRNISHISDAETGKVCVYSKQTSSAAGYVKRHITSSGLEQCFCPLREAN